MSSIKIGVVNDLAHFFAGAENPLLKIFIDAYKLAFEEALEDGLIDRPVEILVADVDGLPTGNVHNVIEGWKSLAAQGVVAMIGPFVSENIIDLKTYVDEVGHVPNLSWPGTDRLYGEWMFGVTNGSLSEEPYLMANFLAHQDGQAAIGVIYEDSAIGHEYLAFMRDACRREGLRIVREQAIGQLQEDLVTPVRELREAGAHSLAYFGFGRPAVFVNRALAELDWDPPRVMNTAFLTAPFLPEGMRAIKGWCGVDQYDETNQIGQDVIARFAARFGYRPANCIPLVSYDVANILCHAFAQARPLSPSGVKAALERVKMVAAATGGAGTLLSFAPYVRRAWLGPDYLVVRKAVSDEPVSVLEDMKTVLVHRYAARRRHERRADLGLPSAYRE